MPGEHTRKPASLPISTQNLEQDRCLTESEGELPPQGELMESQVPETVSSYTQKNKPELWEWAHPSGPQGGSLVGFLEAKRQTKM